MDSSITDNNISGKRKKTQMDLLNQMNELKTPEFDSIDSINSIDTSDIELLKIPSKSKSKTPSKSKSKTLQKSKSSKSKSSKSKSKPIKKGKTQWDLIYEARNLKTPSLPSLSPKQVIESTDSNVSLSDINIDEIDTGVEEMKYPDSPTELSNKITDKISEDSPVSIKVSTADDKSAKPTSMSILDNERCNIIIDDFVKKGQKIDRINQKLKQVLKCLENYNKEQLSKDNTNVNYPHINDPNLMRKIAEKEEFNEIIEVETDKGNEGKNRKH